MSTLAPYEIPLSAQQQKFDIVLGSVDYNMRVVWNGAMSCWVLDIADTNNVPIAQGVPLVTGANLMDQYASLGFPGWLVVVSDVGDSAPGYADLGVTGHLFYLQPQ